MIYRIEGPQRCGKGVFAAAFGVALAESTGLPLFATNSLKGGTKIYYYDDILKLKNCVFVCDEIDNDLQSRNFTANMEKKGEIFEWLKQAGKMDVVLIMVVQFGFQMDKILRTHSNVVIMTEKKQNGSKYTFFNKETGQILKKVGPMDMSPFFELYDHKEMQRELSWRESKKERKKNAGLFQSPEVLKQSFLT